MSKLDNTLGFNKSFDTKVQDIVGKQLDNNFNGKKDIFQVPLKDICLRYNNNYINDKKTFSSLKASIENEGLLQPIIITKIDTYLEQANKEEKDYLTTMKNKYKVKYFIMSGHRRFKAYMSLALKKDIFSDEDVIKFYLANFGDKFYKEYKSTELKGNYEDLNKYLYIPCQITEEVTAEKEMKVYNDTNLTSRPTTNFEFVVNSIEPSGITDNSPAKLTENTEIIRKYINVTYGMDIPAPSIKKYLQLTRELPSSYIKCIFEGKLSIRDAVNLLTKIDDSNKNDILNKIKSGKFDFKKEFSNKDAKAAKKNKIKVYQRLIDKYGDIKLSELIEKIRKES